MLHRDTIVQSLNDYFQVDQFDDFTVNGLQIEGKSTIRKIVTGVSPSERIFKTAIHEKADMIILHHGLFWRKGTPNPFYLRGILKSRVQMVLNYDINLLVYHLPMDAHPEIGNNIQFMNHMNIIKKGVFDVGFWGSLEKPKAVSKFQIELDEMLPDKSVFFPFGPDPISRIAVISGGASREIEGAHDVGADAFVTGDLLESAVRDAEELGIHYISIGHYNSERFGPKALSDYLINHFEIESQFIDIPNPA